MYSPTMFKRLSTSIILLLAHQISGLTSERCPPTRAEIDQFKAGYTEFLQETAAYNPPPEQNFNRSKFTKSPTKYYDFVIVGSGAAGAVMANRLSEIPEFKVLLIEAGVNETQFTKTPALLTTLPDSKYAWNFHTTRQNRSCLGMIGNACYNPYGKMLGGSTSMNGMMYTRGHRSDYDIWAGLGNPGWSYRDLLPYFKKIEDATEIYPIDDGYHNYGGPYHLEFAAFRTNISNKLFAGAAELGFKPLDYNGRNQEGISLPQNNRKRQVRLSTNAAYLQPAIHRPNLIIKPLSLAIRIIINPTTNTATGVEYVSNGKLFVANAKKEVIVSGGTINTPKLLMLSGIGPKKDLRKLNISVIADLPVGKNYKDQLIYLGLRYAYTDTTVPDPNYDRFADYLLNSRGPLTGGPEALLFFESGVPFRNINVSARPDAEIIATATTITSNSSINIFGLKPLIFEKVYAPYNGNKSLDLNVILLDPKSSGTITLKDNDPFHYPLVDQNSFSDPEDQDINRLVAAIRETLKFGDTKAFRNAGLRLTDTPVPGCANWKYNSKRYLRCSVRHLSSSGLHSTGSARMGPIGDNQAVVDSELKVYGIKHLRVADNSVIPGTISGHTMAAAMVVGEKASDLIKATWQ